MIMIYTCSKYTNKRIYSVEDAYNFEMCCICCSSQRCLLLLVFSLAYLASTLRATVVVDTTMAEDAPVIVIVKDTESTTCNDQVAHSYSRMNLINSDKLLPYGDFLTNASTKLKTNKRSSVVLIVGNMN